MANKKTRGWKGFLVTLGVAVLAGTTAMAEEVKVGAGAAPTENIFNKIKEPMEAAVGIKLILISNGPAQALKDLDQGLVDAATGGVTFQDWMAMMEKEGSKVEDPSVYKHRVIGRDLVKVFVHKEIPVKNLTREQLKSIFTGKTTSWREVGGPDIPIVIVFGNKIPGTNGVFQKQIMDGEPYTTQVTETGTAAEVKEKIQATPGGIGLGPVSLTDASINAPEIPEVGRPITLITKGAPSPAVLKMLDYISGEGQKYIAK
ncbi:MAG: phosphate ABC transporter substrate-binding protein [Deltaproteobacteria bacterium]|nr:phosphate ABC transporter substrate-binding protein [Deltaproteobacteria bacterium]